MRRCKFSTYVVAKKALCRLDTSAFNDCLTTKVIGVPEEDKAETLRRLVGDQQTPDQDIDQARHQAAEKDFDVSRNMNTHQVPLIDPIQSQMTWAAGTGYAKPSGSWFTICYRYLFFGINGLISLFGLFLIGMTIFSTDNLTGISKVLGYSESPAWHMMAPRHQSWSLLTHHSFFLFLVLSWS